MQAFFFIVNSRIGVIKMQQLEVAISKYLPGYTCVVKCTEYAGHASVLAQEALLHKNHIVVAVGGDGTVNEIVQVLANSEIPLAIVPTGSGNGLARHCHIPIVLEEAVAMLTSGHQLQIDLGKANSIYFISNAGVGFDATVCNTIRETKSRGLKMYILKVIQNYFSYKRDEYGITTEDRYLKQKAFFLNIANGKEFGYGFEIAPQASLQDGFLDVILVKKINLFTGFSFVLDGWRKRLHKNRNCIYFKAKKLTIEGRKLQYFQTDGDAQNCDGVCEISIAEKALKLVVPSSIEKL
jgi:YegS/Rv2252/BmrU family lipid kinase